MSHPPPALLIVDDDDRFRYLVHAAAERSGIFGTIEEAANGQAALDLILERARRGAGAPDFVLSDLSMPQIDGLELMRELKRHPETEALPVAIMTSSNQPNDREDALAAGCCAFFYKPTRFTEIATMFDTLRDVCVPH